ncbi:MAG: hypothetical protein ACM3SR_18280 [Ignavibacteriales bacterium]
MAKFNISLHPDSITIRERDSEDPIPVKYVVSNDETEINVSYEEDRQVVVIELKKWAEGKASKAAKACVNYLIENLDRLAEKKITNREIARKTGFHEDVIGRVRKRLRKEVPISRKLLE